VKMDEDKLKKIHDEQKRNKRERRKFVLENETKEQKKGRLEKQRERQRHKIGRETQDEKKRRLEDKTQCKKEKIEKEMPERKKMRLKEQCDYQKEKMENEKGLAKWMERQKRSKSLSSDQQQRIVNLGYSLVKEKTGNWTIHCDQIWNDHFESLKHYQTKYGNCNVPSSYTVDPKLANWVASQRQAFGREDLRRDCFQLLRDIGFIFRLVQRPAGVSTARKNEAKWKCKYEQIKELEKIHGSCMIHHVVKDNPTLYNWITRQRQLHKKQMGLSKICVEKLKKLSFPWKQPNKK
jgi:hypothetical protein